MSVDAMSVDAEDPVHHPGRSDACRVHVRGSGETFEVRRNDLLLLSALEQGVAYPHNCRVGTCGSCKTRLLSGRISPMVDFALSPLSNQELQDGYILACQAKVRSDLVVDVVLGDHALHMPRTVSARVVGWKRLPGEVVDLRLCLDEPLPFEAGQYCSLAASGSFVRRSFSFYDAPPRMGDRGAEEVGFLIKRLPGGKFSEWLFAENRGDAKIWLEGPFGQMGVAAEERDGVCIAGGTGLAPILSIVADRLLRTQQARFTIVFGVRDAGSLFAMDRLQQLQASAPERVRVVPVLSHEPAISDWRGQRGLVTAPLDATLGVDFATTAAFVCGSLPMVEAVEARLWALGVARDRIHADKFLPTGF